MIHKLVVVAFDGESTADGMLDNLRDMEQRGLLVIEDAVVASRGTGASLMLHTVHDVRTVPQELRTTRPEVEIRQTAAQRGRSAAAGAGIGMLAGLLVGGPIGGAAVGAVLGAFRDRGIDDRFVKDLSQQLTTDSSAIFLLVDRVDTDQVLAELQPFKGRVIHTTIEPELERDLRKALEHEG